MEDGRYSSSSNGHGSYPFTLSLITCSICRLTVSQLKNALHDVGYEVDHELLEVVDQLETDEDNKVRHISNLLSLLLCTL